MNHQAMIHYEFNYPFIYPFHGIMNLDNFFRNSFNWIFFPQQRKLGVFSHSKGSGAGRSSQNLPVPRFPGRAEQVGATKISGSQVPGKGFAGSQVPRWFPGRVLQVARFPGFKERFSSEGFQEKVPKSRFPRKGSQVNVPK